MTRLAAKIKPERIKAERGPICVLIENVIDPKQGARLAHSINSYPHKERVSLSLGTSLRVQKSLPLSKTGCGPVNNNLCFHSTDGFRARILRWPKTSPGGGKDVSPLWKQRGIGHLERLCDFPAALRRAVMELVPRYRAPGFPAQLGVYLNPCPLSPA